MDGKPLEVSEPEAEALGKLDKVRDRFEHPRPGFWVIEPTYLHELLPVAGRMVLRCLQTVHHHFDLGELERAEAVVQSIEVLCRKKA